MIFSQSKQPVGLDIGSTSLKLVELKKNTKKKMVELHHLGVEEIPPDVIVDGAVMDSSVVVNAIQNIFESNKVKNSNVALSISGNAVIIKRIFLPKMTSQEIEESIKWEAEQYIPFDIDDVSIDYQISRAHAENQEENTEVILVAAKKDKINDYVSVINIAGKKPMLVDVDAFALQNAYEYNYGVEEGKLISLVNVGASVMNINIMDGGTSVFWRDISIGGNQYTDQVQKTFNVSRESAEKLKRGVETENISIEDLLPIINSVSNSIAIEIQKTIDFYQTASSKTGLDKIVLAGGCASITGFAKFLEERFHTEVEIMNSLKNIYVDDNLFDQSYLDEVAPGLAISVGLALREV